MNKISFSVHIGRVFLGEFDLARPWSSEYRSGYSNTFENTGGFIRGLAMHGVTFITQIANDNFPVRATYRGQPPSF